MRIRPRTGIGGPGGLGALNKTRDMEAGTSRGGVGRRRPRAFPILVMLTLVIAGAFALFLLDEAVHFGPTRASNPENSQLFSWTTSSHNKSKEPTGDAGPGSTKKQDIIMKSDTPSPEVHHGFVWSEDQKFVAVDRYLINVEGSVKVVILGDGTVPIDFKENNIALAKFTCSFGEHKGKPARVAMMRGHKRISDHYDTKKQYAFSTNGDNFKAMLIYCNIPVKLDDAAARINSIPLTLEGKGFKLTVSTPFVDLRETTTRIPSSLESLGPPPPVGSMRDDIGQYRLTLCLCPVYGVKSARWLIEYLEYHRAAGVGHVHLYSYDDLHSSVISDTVRAYREQGFVTPHDWSHTSSKGFTQGHTYEHAKFTAMTGEKQAISVFSRCESL
eukprot:jgi/Bigna1/77696/fgenesh1_pg.49_\